MEQSPGEHARALSALRKKARGICAVCGNEFEGLARARFCSRECANAAYWDRNREELNRKRRQRYQEQKAGAEG